MQALDLFAPKLGAEITEREAAILPRYPGWRTLSVAAFIGDEVLRRFLLIRDAYKAQGPSLPHRYAARVTCQLWSAIGAREVLLAGAPRSEAPLHICV